MKKKMFVLELGNSNETLVTREQGERFRNLIIEKLEYYKKITVNLNGLKTITPSFMDECFGKLILEIDTDDFKSRIKLETQNETWRKLINHVVIKRLQQKETA